MKQEKTFVIAEFKNPSGEIVFRVIGWLEGKRVRKNFPTFAEAKAEADGFEIQLLQGETGLPRDHATLRGRATRSRTCHLSGSQVTAS